MEIGGSHLVTVIIMTLLAILTAQVHCSTQPVELFSPKPSILPHSSLDHLTHLLGAYVPISFVGTPHSSVHGYHFSPNQAPEEIERAKNYPWEEELGKPLWEVAGVINEVAPSASIVVKKMDMPLTVYQMKGLELVALLFTDYNDIVTGISLIKKNI